MGYELKAAGKRRLQNYFDYLGGVLGRSERREAFASYATGLLSDCERKSVEPMAAYVCGDPARCQAVTHRLLNFVGDSPWDDVAVRSSAVRYALEAMAAREPITAWVIDDTGFLKQGNKSPGVQRQYTGSAGKTTNCQLGVSLTLTTRTLELPVDMDLYLPTSWTEDRKRCRAAHIPDDVEYRPKWRIALELIERAFEAGYPPGLVLGDSAYGDVGDFRERVRRLGLDYGLDVQRHTRVQIVGSDGSVSDTLSVGEVAHVLGQGAFRTTTWREGTRDKLSSRFAAVRVLVVRDKGVEADEQWLLIEWPKGKDAPLHYVLCTLSKSLTRKQLVRRIKQRWRIERTYQDMKGELGLDHYEGRSYRGWHHHVSIVLACYAFLVAERARAFPPSAGRSQGDNAVEATA